MWAPGPELGVRPRGGGFTFYLSAPRVRRTWHQSFTVHIKWPSVCRSADQATQLPLLARIRKAVKFSVTFPTFIDIQGKLGDEVWDNCIVKYSIFLKFKFIFEFKVSTWKILQRNWAPFLPKHSLFSHILSPPQCFFLYWLHLMTLEEMKAKHKQKGTNTEPIAKQQQPLKDRTERAQAQNSSSVNVLSFP